MTRKKFRKLLTTTLTISGLAFIILVSALIFSEMKEAVKDIKGKSLQDCSCTTVHELVGEIKHRISAF